jgi:hypothetical protein
MHGFCEVNQTKGILMSYFLASSILVLGVGHTLYGLIQFRIPLAAALADGFYNKFKGNELRRTAFWFVAFGPLLMLAGQISIRVVAIGDMSTVRLIGYYLVGVTFIGLAAFPKSPFLIAFPLSLMFLASGYGLLP